MDDVPKRVPVPAGGAPIPSAIEAANATPPAAGITVDAASNATPDRTDDGTLVEARVLVAFDAHEANDVIAAPAVEIERLKLAGQVDPHPDAVAFAKLG